MEWLENLGLLGLFIGTFLAATVIPFSSDAVYLSVLAATGNPAGCLMVGTLGNWLGSVFTYFIGWAGKWEWIEKRFKVKPETLAGQKKKIDRYGVWLALICYIVIYKKDAFYDKMRAERFFWPQIKAVLTQLKLGIPIGLSIFFEVSSFTLMAIFISRLGTTDVSAHQIVGNITATLYQIPLSIAIAVCVMVSQALGAGSPKAAREITVRGLKVALAIAACSVAFMYFGQDFLLGLYTLSPETAKLSAELVWIHCGCGILFWPLAFVLPNALRAANDVRFTMMVSVISMLVWRLGFSQILCVQLGWGARGVWWAMIIDWICRLLCFVIRFASGAWKKHAMQTPA